LIHKIEPEVSGELGQRTVMDTSTHPPVISNLHFVVTGWLGDDLVECFPILLVSDQLKVALESGFSGIDAFDKCEVTESDQLRLMQPDIVLPPFHWIKIGRNPEADFFINEDEVLCVSEKAFELLSKFKIQNAIVS